MGPMAPLDTSQLREVKYMEVTPIGLRDATVSLGNGAAHGRESLPPPTQFKVAAPVSYPMDLPARQVTAALEALSLALDPGTAARLANALLERASLPKWESKESSQPKHSRLDTQA